MEYKMRMSRVLKKLRDGETVSCVKINLADARIIEIAAMAGFDCIWTDLEHVPNDWSLVEKQILAAKVHNVDIVVRTARGSYSELIKPLELDATGIMVPHIMNIEDAKSVVKMTKFHPVGRRAIDGGNADALFCKLGMKDYMSQANSERFVIVQIEDPEPLADLEAIAALPGIDMLFFGPADFSQGIGAPGQMDNPLIQETRQRIAKVAIENGRFAGTVGSPETVKSLRSMGYQFINIGADVIGAWSYFDKLIADFNAVNDTV